MDDDLALLARKHAIAAELRAELEALWERRSSSSGSPSTLVGDLGSLDLALSDERSPAADTGSVGLVADRYEDLGRIGHGGMGEVRRVRDVVLNRTLAMKIVHARLVRRQTSLTRFVIEAQATAQLQHPNIVPVHDLGRLPDGRVWFTMKEVRGRTLGEVIAEMHTPARERKRSGWTFRRVMAAFHVACQAVAYAHDRGVVHRDLKPANTMVGTRGEVYVLDWGLAKIIGRPELVVDQDEPGVVSTGGDEPTTQTGAVTGTPAYMAPEQARGETDQIDARSDVYALGAMLYEILAGRPPYTGSAASVLWQVALGPPAPLRPAAVGFEPSLDEPAGSSRRPIPEELVTVCERAMARDPDDRFETAMALADEVQAWLDGARRRDQALEVTRRALAGVAQAEALVARASQLRAEARSLLEGVPKWESEERKSPGWAREAEAEAAERAAELEQLEVDQTLQAALQIAPDLPEAHAALAQRYQARHGAAEARRQRDEAAKAGTLLATHAAALPEEHEVRVLAGMYLRGVGALTLVTDPPGAEVLLHRCVERDRRLVEVFERSLGRTPLRAVPLPMGSYVCVLRHPDHDEVRYPVEVTRLGHWDGVPPGERDPEPVWLPPRGTLSADEVFVPSGWFRAGGDPEVVCFPAKRVWCDAFVARRLPVTNRAYVAFLDDLAATGREEEALRHAPRERGGTEGEVGALIYGFESGRFSLRTDADGHAWLPDHPVLQVDWHGARAWLAWWAERTGRPWRLPGELEWEKAARGVDGRWYPWGDHFDASWCCMMDSHRGPALPAVVDSYPVDTSPWGVRGLGGNVQQWCLDLVEAPAPFVGDRVARPDAAEDAPDAALRVVRGGSWFSTPRGARAAYRNRLVPRSRYPFLGFRGVYPVGPVTR